MCICVYVCIHVCVYAGIEGEGKEYIHPQGGLIIATPLTNPITPRPSPSPSSSSSLPLSLLLLLLLLFLLLLLLLLHVYPAAVAAPTILPKEYPTIYTHPERGCQKGLSKRGCQKRGCQKGVVKKGLSKRSCQK